jgi:hypothetical protein
VTPKFVTCFCLALSCASGSIIDQSMRFTCIAGKTLVIGSSGCAAFDPTTGASSSGSASVSMTDVTQPTLSFSGALTLNLQSWPVGADVAAEISAFETFTTPGMARSGFLEYDTMRIAMDTAFQYISGSFGAGDVGFGFGNGASLPAAAFGLPFLYPFQLGVPVAFRFQARAEAGEYCPCAMGPSGSATGFANIVFHLLESDGVTPVVMQATPEPSEWALLGIALIWLRVYRTGGPVVQ